MLPATQRVLIEGHTDAVGSELYNESLSQRRAQSVRRYLVAMHGIDAGRLEAVGLGETQPAAGPWPAGRREPPRAVPRRMNRGTGHRNPPVSTASLNRSR